MKSQTNSILYYELLGFARLFALRFFFHSEEGRLLDAYDNAMQPSSFPASFEMPDGLPAVS
jgi:hypothetical protein